MRRSPAALIVRYLGALPALAGCAVGPSFTPPEVTIAEKWRAHGDPRVAERIAGESRWWKQFNDPALERLVELAFAQNLPLQIASLRIVEARARLGIATGRQYPQSQALFASATAVGLTDHLADLVRLDRNFLFYQVGFDAVWEVDFWGKYRRGVESEAASLLASVGDYYASVVALAAEVARTYVVIRTFEALIAEARANAAIQQEGFHIAESRFRNGATSELDVSQAKTLLQSTLASIPRLQTSLQQSRNAMMTLLGQPPAGLDVLLGGAKDIPSAPAQVAVGVPADVLRRRPDIRAAELNAAAQCARIGVAKAELYPSFSLLGTIGLRASTISNTSQNLFSTNSLFYSAGPQINWPFLNYGRLRNAVRVEDARFQQSLVAYRDAVLRAVQEVEDALAGFLNAGDAVVLQESAVKAAERSVQIAVTEYREGATDYQRVLDAQRSLLQQQTELTQNRSSVATNLIAVYKALGGGWEVRLEQSLIPEGTRREMKQRTDWGDMLDTVAPVTAQNPSGGKH